jgi:hypothetical protein
MRRSLRTAVLLGTCICTVLVGQVGNGAAAALAATGAEGYGYKYVSLDAATPPGALFTDYFGVTTTRTLYGNAWTCADSCVPSLVSHRNGTTTVLHRLGLGYSVNESGVVGGSVLTDPAAFVEQAAVFNGSTVQLIPRLPNEQSSHVMKLTDTGIALVESLDANFASTHYLRVQGRSVPLNLGTDRLTVNNAGIVAGTVPGPSNHDRAFRFRPPAGPKQVLDPLPTEPDSWGQGINGRGDVLGYSFVPGGLERIGYWHDTTFVTSFVEGTPQYPTVSNALLWNESGLIVITADRRKGQSFIVPRPGLRLNLADLTTTALPAFTTMVDVNEVGDVLGWGGSAPFTQDHYFLLERTGISR